LPPSVTIDLQTQLVASVVVVSPFAGNTAKQWFAATLARLEAAGVHIAAFELGNELNTPRFNAVRKDVAQVDLRHLRSRWFHHRTAVRFHQLFQLYSCEKQKSDPELRYFETRLSFSCPITVL
jgi:hypothetical protein